MRWDLFFISIKNTYYIIPLMMLLALAVVCYGVIKKKKLGSTKWLVWQAVASLLQCGFEMTHYHEAIYNNKPLVHTLQVISEGSYLLAEVSFCTLFIIANIVSPVFKKIISIYTVLVIVAILIVFFATPLTINSGNIPFAIENICLTASCILYVIDLFHQPPTRNLQTEPAFWAVSGMLLLFSVTTPLFLLINTMEYFFANTTVYLINYILYCILYLTYLKAIQCSPAQPK
jgi:hypothetical protein